MDITTNDIINAIELADKYYENPSIRRKLLSDKAKQTEEEEQLKNKPVCNLDDLNKIRDRLGSIDKNRLRDILTKYFYNGTMMKVAFCIFESILSDRGPLADGGLTENERIRYWLHADRQIGSESVFGYAISTSFDDSDNLLVVKAPRPGVGPGDGVHEYIVGALALNNIRKYVPNFAYVFGTFDCSSPVIGANKEIDTWCGYQPGVNYVIYENVNPSTPLGNLNKSIGFDKFLNYYLQIMLALRVAYSKYDFTHYDLHDQNVLVRKLDRMVAIPYDTPKGKRYIVTDSIATVIDYGQSHVKIDGKSFGFYGLEAYGTLADHSFPLFDAYKLLLMSMRTMLTSNNINAFNGAATLLKFFTRQEAKEVVKSQSKLYYVLPRIDKTLSATLDDYIDYILSLYSASASLTSDIPVLECTAEQCNSPRASLSWLKISDKPEASGLIDLYDLSEKFKQEGQLNKEKQLLNSYPYNDRIGSVLQDVKHNLTELYHMIQSLRKPAIGHSNYRKAFDQFAEYVDCLEDVTVGLEALYQLSNDYGDDVTRSAIAALLPLYNNSKTKLQRLAIQYIEDANSINRQTSRQSRSASSGSSSWLTSIFPQQALVVAKTLMNIIKWNTEL